MRLLKVITIVALIGIALLLSYSYYNTHKNSFSFSNENKSIQLVKNYPFLDGNYLQVADMRASFHSSDKYIWKSTSTAEDGVYLVSFESTNGDNLYWEADLNQGMVKWVNGDKYLEEKYDIK